MNALSRKLFTLIGATLLACSLVGCNSSSSKGNPPPSGDVDITTTDPSDYGTGDGSVNNPYNCNQAIAIAKGLESGGQTALKFFIKGKIVSGTIDISSVGQYGNTYFSLSDTGGSKNKFKCYQVYYLNAAKFTSTTAATLKDGDDITVFSAIVNYGGNTPETTSKGSAYVYQHNNKKSSSVPEQGFPTPDPSASVKTISALISENSSWKTEGAKSTTLYRITGVAQYATSVNWGNFDLLDSTGYIHVRGCVSSKKSLVDSSGDGKVIDNDGSFASMGIVPGDTVTIEGWYAYHKYTNTYGVPQFTGYVTDLVKGTGSSIPSSSYTASETYSGSYYSSIGNATGNELLKGLHNLMDSTHTYYTSYSSLEGHYSSSDPYPSGGIKCFYSGQKVTSSSQYNKEHVWPQSLSGSSSAQLYGEDHGGSDLHHIRPTKNDYNSKRSNAMFGYIYPASGSSYKGGELSYAGGSKDYYITNTFEPADEIKGDISRIIMYMYMHYNDGTISELSGISGWNKKDYYGEMHINWVMGPNSVKDCFKLLRHWNAIDPVSEDEKTRNEYAYSVQHNRNPFIDHPTYADKIWG